MAFRTEWIDDASRLAALQEPWDRLAGVDPTPFARHAWLTAWWRAFGDGRRMRICAVSDGDELVAALALAAPARGRTLTAMANAHSPAFRPLARDDAGREALADALLAAHQPLVVPALPARAPEGRALIRAMERRGARSVLEPDYVSPVTDTVGSFDDLRTTMKKHWRELERRGRKMRREHDVEERLVERPADLPAELETGLALEAAGWKGRAGTAILTDNATAAFYRDVAAAFNAAGELRFSALTMDGRLVAWDYALLHRGRYFLLKTAFDEDLRTLAPGLVLRRSVIERCFGLGLESHEFLGGDMEWKRLFATGEREHFVWRCYPPGLAGAAARRYRQAIRPRLRAAYVWARSRRGGDR